MTSKPLNMNSIQIAEIMGTVGSPLIILSELIKNAVDASADQIDIYIDFDNNSIKIVNDNCGFTVEDIEELHNPGSSRKKTKNYTKNNKGMYLTGSKGLGILSSFLVSNEIVIKTVTESFDVYEIVLSKSNGTVNYEKTGAKADSFYTEIIIKNVNPETLSFLSSEGEVKKLKHICTALYKHKSVPFPNMYLHITGKKEVELLLKCDFPEMLYDVTFSFDKKNQELKFKCYSPNKTLNDGEIIINDFSIENLKNTINSHYSIIDTITTRTNDNFTFPDFNNVPSFEGEIIVYEKNMAGDPLKTYGAGVNIYINDFALYNYLSEENDWLGLADFSQRKKATRLKPHNVFGYVNFPNFNDREEILQISNERADFIQDTTFQKLMYLLKGVVMFLTFNIDVADKNPKYKRSTNTNNQTKAGDSSIDSNDSSNTDEATTSEKISEEESISDNKNNDTLTSDYYPDNNYKNFKPKANTKNSFCFTFQDRTIIDNLKDKDDLSNKIYSTIYELSRLDANNNRYSIACLYRVLLESASKRCCIKYSITIKENLADSIIAVLNHFGQNSKNATMPSDKEVKIWRNTITKDKLVDTLNEYIHNETPVDMYKLFESWYTMKNYIMHCIS